jgi:outer membrane protein assembly factor BamD
MDMRSILIRISSLAIVIALLAGCSWLPKQKDETKGWSAQRLYSAAKHRLKEGDYEESIKYYRLLAARYPFGRFAQQGALEVTYAYYKNEDFDQALAACDRFIKANPTHPNVDYAYYLRGLINYRYKKGILERIFPVDPSTRDPGPSRQAFFDFKTLIQKFPNSKYAKDAAQRMVYLRNNMAKYEIVVARFYMKRSAYIAAVNRAKYVIKHFDETPSVRDALEVMYISYNKMGLNDLARDTKRVIRKNYPDHPIITGKQPRRGLFKRFKRKKNS